MCFVKYHQKKICERKSFFNEVISYYFWSREKESNHFIIPYDGSCMWRYFFGNNHSLLIKQFYVGDKGVPVLIHKWSGWRQYYDSLVFMIVQDIDGYQQRYDCLS